MTEMVFHTDGDWDSTTLYNNGVEVPAAQLFVELRAGRDDYGDPDNGGIWNGANLTAYVRPERDPDNPIDILPGRITMEFPGNVVVLENFHPMVDVTSTRVAFNGADITDRVVDLYADVNSVEDIVKAFLTVYKPHWIRRNEVITYSFIG